MTGITELIVSFWFYPVTLFILVPLVMLFGWLMLRLASPMFSGSDEPEKKEEVDSIGVYSE